MPTPSRLLSGLVLLATLVGGASWAAATPAPPLPPAWGTSPAASRCALAATGSSTRRLVEQALEGGGTPAWLPQVRARCRYSCRCYYVNRTKRSCEHALVLDCAGRLCSACVERAKAKARRSCRTRGAVRRCGCPFRRLGLKP